MKIVHTIQEPTDYVRALVFSSDEKTVITGCKDGTIRLFEVDSGEQILQVSLIVDESVAHDSN